jgi:hypothetical protein
MLNQTLVTLADEKETAADQVLDYASMSTEELLDYVDGNDLFTPVALKVFLAKGENGNGKTDPRLINR